MLVTKFTPLYNSGKLFNVQSSPLHTESVIYKWTSTLFVVKQLMLDEQAAMFTDSDILSIFSGELCRWVTT